MGHPVKSLYIHSLKYGQGKSCVDDCKKISHIEHSFSPGIHDCSTITSLACVVSTFWPEDTGD